MAIEYKTIRVSLTNDASLTEMLNKEGKDGWEIVSVSPANASHIVYFKRAIKGRPKK